MSDTEYDGICKILEKHRSNIHAMQNVVGCGVGVKQIDSKEHYCIVVFVNQKIANLEKSHQIPEQFDGIPTDVRELKLPSEIADVAVDGTTRAQESAETAAGAPPPKQNIKAALSFGDADPDGGYSAGSIGMVFKNGTDSYFLSAFHCLCIGPPDSVAGGKQKSANTYLVNQPSSFESNSKKVGRVYDWVDPVPSGNPIVYTLSIDAATAYIDPSLGVAHENRVAQIGVLTGQEDCRINQAVCWQGAFGGLAYAKIATTSTSVTFPIMTEKLKNVTVTDLFTMNTRPGFPFSQGANGDSGCPVFSPQGEFIGIFNGANVNSNIAYGTSSAAVSSNLPSFTPSIDQITERYTIQMYGKAPDGSTLALSPSPSGPYGSYLQIQVLNLSDPLQHWYLEYCPTFLGFTIKNRVTGEIIQATSNNKSATVNLAPQPFDGNMSSLNTWTINPCGKGYFGVRPSINSDLNLNAKGDNWVAGVPIILWNWGGNEDNMSWIFVAI